MIKQSVVFEEKVGEPKNVYKMNLHAKDYPNSVENCFLRNTPTKTTNKATN